MVRRVTPAQYQSMMREAARKQQRAIDDYNRAVREHNAEVQRQRTRYRQAVDNYNREVRAHNARVIANRQRLKTELSRLASARVVVTASTYYQTVTALHRSYEEVERVAPGTWLGDRDDILDLAQQETSNSVTVTRALEQQDVAESGGDNSDLDPAIAGFLTDFSPDLASRWRGALFALSPQNPDAARHFSTSAREILTRIIEEEAPDAAVILADPQCPCGSDGRPTRRARLAFCLTRAGRASDSLSAFADADVANVIELFRVFNDGTHGSAGVFDLRHLRLIRTRVEGAVAFLHSVLR